MINIFANNAPATYPHDLYALIFSLVSLIFFGIGLCFNIRNKHGDGAFGCAACMAIITVVLFVFLSTGG